MDKPRVLVEFNEIVQDEVVLLSRSDEVTDSAGNSFLLKEGLEVSVYEFNHYDGGIKEFLFADGVAELNELSIISEWSKAVKWCCRINENGITVKNT
ncbi:hypothetical protein [Microbulbifer discodermiae]|uniref:hypothetical protein n=1 Tax=Microbulbifer sp. 2201CG32-9 TaxID=3232309 RepID=UPI00345BAD09